jgi:hypothetical protein
MTIQATCTWNPKLKTVVVNDVYLRGITDLLKCTFYPYYSFKTATKGPFVSCFNIDFSSSGLIGVQLGKRLDLEMNKYSNNKLDMTTSLQESKVLINYLMSKTITIINCQFPVCDELSRVCTCIDLLGQTSDGAYVIIEIKTGYRTYKYKHSNQMSVPFEYSNDCVHNQHQLQLLLTTMLFEKSFPNVVTTSLLLYVYTDQVVEHRINQKFYDSKEKMFNIIQSTSSQTKKIRRYNRNVNTRQYRKIRNRKRKF